MSQPQLRRILAALTLAALVVLAPANAATRGERRAQARSTRTWIAETVNKILEKAGIRIDPNGGNW
jgi:hypothetical protein